MACLLDDGVSLIHACMFAAGAMYVCAALRHASCAFYVGFHNCHVRRPYLETGWPVGFQFTVRAWHVGVSLVFSNACCMRLQTAPCALQSLASSCMHTSWLRHFTYMVGLAM